MFYVLFLQTGAHSGMAHIKKKNQNTVKSIYQGWLCDCLGVKNQLIIIHLSPSATVTVLVQSNNDDDNTRNYDSNTYLYLRLHHGNKILDWNDGQHLIHLLHPGSSLTYSGTKWLCCIYYYITYLKVILITNISYIYHYICQQSNYFISTTNALCRCVGCS